MEEDDGEERIQSSREEAILDLEIVTVPPSSTFVHPAHFHAHQIARPSGSSETSSHVSSSVKPVICNAILALSNDNAALDQIRVEDPDAERRAASCPIRKTGDDDYDHDGGADDEKFQGPQLFAQPSERFFWSDDYYVIMSCPRREKRRIRGWLLQATFNRQ